MLPPSEIEEIRKQASSYLDRAGIVITKKEYDSLEVVDLNLGRFHEIGLTILVYVNTDRVCAKELILFPHQICPEHRHPPVAGTPGKEETFRCRWGRVYLYVPGEPTPAPHASVPMDKRNVFTVWHEIILNPGDQYTLPPDTLHWFQAGAEGAVVSEFSTTSRDATDVFTDPEIRRL